MVYAGTMALHLRWDILASGGMEGGREARSQHHASFRNEHRTVLFEWCVGAWREAYSQHHAGALCCSSDVCVVAVVVLSCGGRLWPSAGQVVARLREVGAVVAVAHCASARVALSAT